MIGGDQLSVGQLDRLVLPVDVALGAEHLPLGINQMDVAEGRRLMGLAHQADPIRGQRGCGLVDHRVAGDYESVGLVVVLELAPGHVDRAMMGSLQDLRRARRGRFPAAALRGLLRRPRRLRVSVRQTEHRHGREHEPD